jgi:hypothetical protein
MILSPVASTLDGTVTPIHRMEAPTYVHPYGDLSNVLQLGDPWVSSLGYTQKSEASN